MSTTPGAWRYCIVRYQQQWYTALFFEADTLVTVMKTKSMPGDGFVPMEGEYRRRRGTMFRRVPACEVEAYPVILYKGEGATLGEMDPASDTFRVSLDSGICTIEGTKTAAGLDGWAVVGERGLAIASPYLDPEDPRIELVPGLPFPPGVQPVPKATATWPPRPPGAVPRRLRFIAQHRGAWYIAVWNEGDAEATLLKSARMPGEGFTPVQNEPARSQGVMERRVPTAEVQAFPTLLYQAAKVQLGAMDREASTLRVSLVAPFFAMSGEQSTGHAAGWRVLDAAAQLVESPFMAPSDRRIHAVAGLPLVS